MNRRSFLHKSVAIALLDSLCLKPAYSGDDFLEGVHYQSLEKRLPISVPAGSVEVIQFFSYACPHCANFEPALATWRKKHLHDITFRRVHVGWTGIHHQLLILYSTLEMMNLAERLHSKVFVAIQEERRRLNRIDDLLLFIESNGVNRGEFEAIYRSADVLAKAQMAIKSKDDYRIDEVGVPAIGIHGRFYTSPSLAGSQSLALEVTDHLVTKIRRGDLA